MKIFITILLLCTFLSADDKQTVVYSKVQLSKSNQKLSIEMIYQLKVEKIADIKEDE